MKSQFGLAKKWGKTFYLLGLSKTMVRSQSNMPVTVVYQSRDSVHLFFKQGSKINGIGVQQNRQR